MDDVTPCLMRRRDQASFRHDWWRGAVMYRIDPLSFSGRAVGGAGDVSGVIARLEYVAALGVDAICLSLPPDLSRGQGDDRIDDVGMDRLLAKAHGLGLKVLIEPVLGQVSAAHPWFVESRSSRANSRADWFVWADPAPDGMPPNNWLSVHGGRAWQWEAQRGQYYLHHSQADRPKLNMRHPAVVQAVMDAMHAWLDRGVDGFHVENIDFLAHAPELIRNAAHVAITDDNVGWSYAPQVHRHDRAHADGAQILNRLREMLGDYPGTVLSGRVACSFAQLRDARDMTADDVPGTEHMDMVHLSPSLASGLEWAVVRGLVAGMEDGHPFAWPCWSLPRHDAARMIAGAAPEEHASLARLIMSLLLSWRGSVGIGQGDELGVSAPQGGAGDHPPSGRDGTMADISARMIDRQEHDAQSSLNAWRAALAFRAQHPALARGTLRALDLPQPCIGFVREHERERILCLFNLSAVPQDVARADVSELPIPWVRPNGRITLPAYGTCFVRLLREGHNDESLSENPLMLPI